MKVIVVTLPKLGWDCIIGVYSMEVLTYEELCNTFPDEDYVFHERTVEWDLENI